jgi:crotonobetainyl-CoA:carnitine CoA-transferase CaiB-like acyl-CoA transferase
MVREAEAQLPLSGLKVIDLTLARAGPTCVRHLADWGAEVIRVLPPESPRQELANMRRGSDYQNLHRNKRTVVIDLKSEEGHAALIELARHADVLVENMRVQVKHRLKIAWEDLRAINPRLVYGSISGFGQSGPYAERAGVDQIAQGMGGLMSVTGEPGKGPVRAGIAVADMTAGNLLALAIMMALYERNRTGVGRWVHTSLLESQVFMMDFQAARYLMDGEVPGQVGNGHPTLVPTGTFATSDGYVNVAPSSPKQWKTFCEVLGRAEWLANPAWRGFNDRRKQRAEIDAAIALEMKKQSTTHWVERLEQAGIPCGPIYQMDEVFADPQVQHLGLAATVIHPERGEAKLVGSPLNIDGVTKTLRSAAEIEPSARALVSFERKPEAS